ncbi:hypothetical protein PYCCODRAFT_1430513 [Trametes coccinea BRFM310]|uniref:Uncharacterized protein n=1 Tax=Trametes coccinea (strain BRFM310) TaxID=1353009 RepID=A0A1Y2J4A8_TRAC3|nr:hypothetical protein PYCCODRAFT_1430513 [Trametes coccinea BRFM310]
MSIRHSFLSTTGLIRPPSVASVAESVIPPSRHAKRGGTKPEERVRPRGPPTRKPVARAGVIPLGPTFIVGLAVFLSLLFILAVSCAFIPDEDERITFANILDDIAANAPGIVLVGDDVDVDVDEPALTIRWSILGCGQEFVLSGSPGSHGSASCGLPAMPLTIYVDGGTEPAATYDPMLFPYLNETGQRNNIQSLFQFDDDHVLDVHEARLYPFDTYLLTSSLRAWSTASNESLPIQRLLTIPITSNFVISSSDTASTVKNLDGSEVLSRDIVLQVNRPAEARVYALLLFGSSWMLAHATMALVAFSWHIEGVEKTLRNLAFTLLVVLLIPQLRGAMPDAPGYDGVLIDAIGFFPQMLTSAFSALVLFIMAVKRELQASESNATEEPRHKEAPAPLSTGLLRMRRGGASVDISHIRNISRSWTNHGRPAPT